MISCDKAQSLCENLISGTITPSERTELEIHTQTCSKCREELKQFELYQEVITDAFTPQVEGKQAKAQILEQLAQGKAPHKVRRSASWMRTGIAAVIMLFMGLSLGMLIDRQPIRSLDNEVPICVARVEGLVLVRHQGSDHWRSIEKGDVVYRGDTFHTAAQARFILELENNSNIKVTPNSLLSLVTYGDETEFTLEQGECTASLQSPHGPFFIRTPHGRMEALGTEFTVKVTEPRELP